MNPEVVVSPPPTRLSYTLYSNTYVEMRDCSTLAMPSIDCLCIYPRVLCRGGGVECRRDEPDRRVVLALAVLLVGAFCSITQRDNYYYRIGAPLLLCFFGTISPLHQSWQMYALERVTLFTIFVLGVKKLCGQKSKKNPGAQLCSSQSYTLYCCLEPLAVVP